MISTSNSGSFNKTMSFLNNVRNIDSDIRSVLESAGRRGVDALAAATPVDSGLTASSWTYEVETKGDITSIHWLNTHNVSGVNIAIILQYGHATGTGGWVAGQNYINPAVRSIFDEIANDVWKKVTSA